MSRNRGGRGLPVVHLACDLGITLLVDQEVGDENPTTTVRLYPRDPRPRSPVLSRQTSADVGIDSGRHAVRYALPLLLVHLSACSAGSDDVTSPTTNPTPASIELTTTRVTLTWIGESGEIGAVVRDEGGKQIPQATVTWSSANPAIVRIESSTGNFEALADGTTMVTASVGAVRASAEITVDQVATQLEIDRDSVSMIIGNTVRLRARATDQGGTEIHNPPIWETSSMSLEVDARGFVLSRGGGGLVVARMDGSS